jgi:hypothetical protein
MNPRNLSQEAHLWYTITSPEYLAQVKPKLQEASVVMRQGVEDHPFIKDYAPVPYWSGVMEEVLDSFDNALATLKHGNFGPMIGVGARLESIPRGLQEGNMNWGFDVGHFMANLNAAISICDDFWRAVVMSTMYSSEGYKNRTADWHYDVPEDMGIEGNDIARIYENHIFPTLPTQIPEYAPDTSVSCATGDMVPWTGVWVPSTGMGTAALAFGRKDIHVMQAAYEIASVDEDGYSTFKVVDCTWHPVKPTGRMIDHPVLAQFKHDAATAPRRCEAGERCPREGYWFTPAQENSRRSFKLSEMMPNLSTDYGGTIWQWDVNQA